MSKKTQTLRRGEVLVMKVVEAGGGSYNGFIWPTAVGAEVEAPDWKPASSCGNGLHGWLWGLGDLGVCNGRDAKADAVWMALAVDIQATHEELPPVIESTMLTFRSLPRD